MKRLLRRPWVIALALALTAFGAGLSLLLVVVVTIAAFVCGTVSVATVQEDPLALGKYLGIWGAGILCAWCYWKLARWVFGILWNSAIFHQVAVDGNGAAETLEAERRP